MMGALYLKPAPSKVLVIGLGGGTLPSALFRALPETDFDIVEIDPAVVRVAKKILRVSANVQRAHNRGRRAGICQAGHKKCKKV